MACKTLKKLKFMENDKINYQEDMYDIYFANHLRKTDISLFFWII